MVPLARSLCQLKSWGLTWTLTDFDDQAWIEATTGVGMERNRGYESFFGKNGNLTRSLYGINASVYLRLPFSLTDVEAFAKLTLRMKFDDGFVAYLNGHKVAQANAPRALRFNSGAVADNPDSSAIRFKDVDITQHANRLLRGNNVLAIHGLNGGSASSDLLILPELHASTPQGTTLGNAGYFTEPTPGRLNGASYRGFLGKVSASHQHGFFEDPFELTLASDDEEDGVQIVYTTDGDVPNASTGQPFTNALTIDRTTVLRAAAVKPGYQSEVSTYSFFFLEDIIDQHADGSAPEGWPSRPVNRQIFDYGMDPQVVGNCTHARR